MSALDIENLAHRTRKTAPKIVVVGSINCDLTSYVDDFPSPNATVMANGSSLSLGGKGLNQAVAAARAGAQVEMIACVGNDSFGKLALEYLDKNGVCSRHVRTIEGVPTGTANILVTADAQNMIVVSPGANAELSAQYVNQAQETIASADILIVQMEVPHAANLTALQIAKSNGVRTVVNPAPANPLVRELLPLTDVFTPNETEMEELTGIYPDAANTIEEAATKLSAFTNGTSPTIVITRGERGCSIISGGVSLHVPSYKVNALDPTGAGDVFNGVFSVAFAENAANENDLNQLITSNSNQDVTPLVNSLGIEYAVKYASAAAAISVTRRLAEGAAPFKDEIVRFQQDADVNNPIQQAAPETL